MKRKLLTLTLAVLTVGLLGSCSKINERIDNLEKRVDGIESTSIASVQQQIDGIKTSINDLKAADAAIGGKIDDLKKTAEAQQTLIDALKEADKALGQKDEELEGRIATLEGQVATINGQIETLVEADKAINTRIDELKSYVDTQIGNTKDWAEETFATLDQYQRTADDLAALSVTVTGISTTLAGVQTSISGLDTKIDGINTDLQGKITAAKTELEGKITSLKTELETEITTKISASETSIKSWINERLDGYYTAAEVDFKITGLNTAIDAAKGTAKYRIDSLATELTKLKTAVDTAKANIRSEYKTAIATAITKLDGEIRGALKDSILAVNGRVAALDTRVTNLENRVLAVEGNVNKLLAMIQSVSITPAYSDGSVEAVDGILTLKCIVRPAEALTGMQSLKDSLLIYADSVKVKTKAATSAYMEIKVKEASILDASQGAITLKADISEYLPKGADKALTVALKIKNGISDYTTEFVQVTTPVTTEVTKIVKWGNKAFSYDDQGKLSQITEYSGADYSKNIFEYDGNTVNVMNEEKWGDWHQDPKLAYVLTLNADGYVTAMTVKKGAGDIEYTFTYTNGFLTAGALKDGTQLFIRTVSDENVASWTQCKRFFEYGLEWEKATVENARQIFTFGSDANVGGFPADMIDYRRNPDKDYLTIDKMFLQAGLFGKASKMLPTQAVWRAADGSALPDTYLETNTEYFYQFDAENHVIGLSNDRENYTEIVWEKITLK